MRKVPFDQALKDLFDRPPFECDPLKLDDEDANANKGTPNDYGSTNAFSGAYGND